MYSVTGDPPFSSGAFHSKLSEQPSPDVVVMMFLTGPGTVGRNTDLSSDHLPTPHQFLARTRKLYD